MRKRIVTGLLAIVVIGTVAFWVSQARKGSVEWHKREYLEAADSSREELAVDGPQKLAQRHHRAPTRSEQCGAGEENVSASGRVAGPRVHGQARVCNE